MTSLVNFFSSNDNIIIIILMLAIVILMGAILIIDIKTKKKKVVVEEGINLNNTSNFEEEITANEEVFNQVQEIRYVEEDSELEKIQAKQELENLKAELEKAELENKQEVIIPVDEVNSDVENKPVIEVNNVVDVQPVVEVEKDFIEMFEDEQEEKAIISVAELTKKVDELYDQNEVTQYEDEGNEPISIQELEALYKASTMSDVEVVAPEVIEVKETIKMDEEFKLTSDVKVQNTKFTSSPVISPVYGISEVQNKENSLDNINLEQTANLEKLNEELRKVNEFLVAIKELKNKLQ